MQLKTFNYQSTIGWSIDSFPTLDSVNTAVFIFASPSFFNKVEPLIELKKFYANSVFIGCSTSGEIFHEGINDQSISVAVIKFDSTNIKVVSENINDVSESFLIGKKIATSLEGDNLKGIFLLSDGITVNGSNLVSGLKQNISPEVIITGGLAGDGKDFKKTWVLKDNKPSTRCITALGFYGKNIYIGHGSQGGWDIFGPERLITRSKDNILYEIDGQPALDLYKKYLGNKASELPASALLFPLAIHEKLLDKNHVVRTILSVDEQNKSITFAGNVPQGWYGQFMKTNFDRLVAGAAVAGKDALTNLLGDEKKLAIAVSCIGRRLVLGERSEEEIEAALETLGNNSELIGFYSYGEIAPSTFSNCDLHNQTMTLTTISEH